MATIPPCVGLGQELVEVDSGFYWLISPGIDPSTVLTQDQIDCHFTAAEQVNASYEATVAAAGKYVQWRMGPVWEDFVVTTPQDWAKAESLADVGIDCDVDAWNAAYEPTAHFRYLGTSGKGLKTYYCIGDSPPEPPVDPPPDGPYDCGEWDVLITRPVQVPIDTETWIEFQITGTFPPEVDDPFEITVMFDGSTTLVAPDAGSGVLEIDEPGRRVKVVLRDNQYHHLDIFVGQPDCTSPGKFDTEMLRASTTTQPTCVESLGTYGLRVCQSGDYKAVLTVCGQDVESNTLTVTTGTLLPQPPIIIQHPQTQVVGIGSEVVLGVVALYATSYQWQAANEYGWVDLPGETAPSLTLSPIELADAGRYRAVVSNAAGSVTSNPADVTVTENSDCPVYINLRCEIDRTCHGVMLERVGPGEDDIDYVADWISTTAFCCEPVVVRCPGDSTEWELFMSKSGDEYVIDWRAATASYTGQRMLYFAETNRCYSLIMTKVGPGSAKEDYVLDWELV